MVMVDLGIPPGFGPLSQDLGGYHEKSEGQKSGRLEKFSLTATQAILYFNSFAPGDTVTLKLSLRAKYSIRARTFQIYMSIITRSKFSGAAGAVGGEKEIGGRCLRRNDLRERSNRVKQGRSNAVPLQKQALGAEEDGFALEHFDGEEERGGGVHAGREENEGNGVPVVGACDDVFAHQAGVEDRNQSELGREFDPGHEGSNGGNDNYKGHGSEVALGFFVALGEERDGQQDRGK